MRDEGRWDRMSIKTKYIVAMQLVTDFLIKPPRHPANLIRFALIADPYDILSPATTIFNQRVDCFQSFSHHINHLIDIVIDTAKRQARETSSKSTT